MRDGCNDSYEVVRTDAAGNQSLEVVSDSYRNPSYKGIPYYQSQLNRFVTSFAKEFNDIISKGQLAMVRSPVNRCLSQSITRIM